MKPANDRDHTSQCSKNGKIVQHIRPVVSIWTLGGQGVKFYRVTDPALEILLGQKIFDPTVDILLGGK